MVADRSSSCSEISRAANEPIAGTAPQAVRWLLIEAPGAWGRDAVRSDGIPQAVARRLESWESEGSPGRILRIRRPGSQRVSGAAVILVGLHGSGAAIERLELARIEEIVDIDLNVPAPSAATVEPLVLVCTHGTRDSCCARLGLPVLQSLAHELGDDLVWQCSHLGGHRFAGNVLVFPIGMMLGRVGPADATAVASLLRDGKLPLDLVRGRVRDRPEVQAAEHEIRRQLDATAIADVVFLGSNGSTHRFSTPRGEARVRVDRKGGPLLPLSCGAEPERSSRLVARLL